MVTARSITTTIFISLILDLLAFTIPLPLFPRLIAWYLYRESHSSDTLLSRLLHLTNNFRAGLLGHTGGSSAVGGETKWLWTGGSEGGSKSWDIVLLGGAMGSLFSFCQCLISPWLGRLSDKYGRKNVLLATMLGNILSAIIWLRSTTFSTFLLSRLVGGLSEGNVQLSTAIISDVTPAATRSKSLALIGIVFSVCFTLGPSLGAYFASRPLPLSSSTTNDKWNVYALPAAISLVFLIVETIYLAIKLPETKGWKKPEDTDTPVPGQKEEIKETTESRLNRLRAVGRLHGLFLLFFSGAEFTLTFLTYDLFAASNSQNGRLLSYIGILSALLQGRYVRPSLAKIGELRIASLGITSCSLGLILLAILPLETIRSSPSISTFVLYSAATALAYTSATVVTGLTASAAGCCDEGNEALKRGRALGGFRSKGQLGRAIGPILASSIYWLKGPTICYSLLAACLGGVSVVMRGHVEQERLRRKAINST